ncbi:hypothetical protein ACWDTP_04670 [Mycobacterium sp. NPDC003449]
MWRSDIARSAIRENYPRYVWFVAWPLILLALVGSCSRSCSTPDTVASPDFVDAVTASGANATLAYLTANPGDAERLKAIFGANLIKAPEGQQGIPLPRKTVLSSTSSAKRIDGEEGKAPDGKDGSVWLVKVSIVTPDGSEVWQTKMRATAGPAFRPVELPGRRPDELAGPEVAPVAVSSLDIKCADLNEKEGCKDSDKAIVVTLRDFFDAWLCGKGDLARDADTAKVPAFARPPYSRAQMVSVTAAAAVPNKVEGVLPVQVIVWASKTSTEENSYTLTLTASAGRWVVADIASPPPVKESKSDATR